MNRITDDQVNDLAKGAAISQYGSENHEEFASTVNGFIMGFNEARKYMDGDIDKVELNAKEKSDIRRGLIIAMHKLDATKNGPDILLSNRLEVIEGNLRDK